MTSFSYIKIHVALFCAFFVLYSAIFLSSFFPLHDTLSTYTFFNIAYSDFYFNKEIIQWLPYSSYGVNADWYFFNCMTVFKYFFIAAGSLLHIKNAFLLFKISMLFEQAVFVLGVFILSRALFKRHEVALFVCICTVGSLVLANQNGLNFYSYYLLPFVLHYIFRYFEERRISLLLLSILILLLSVPGQAVYFLIIFAMELTILFTVLCVYHFRDYKKFLHIKKNDLIYSTFYFCSSVLVLAALIYSSFRSLEHYKTLSTGRDLITKHTPLDVFLTYGGLTNYLKFQDLVIPEILKTPGNLDMTLYAGLLVLPFILYALIFARKPQFIAILITLVIMGLFSVGGTVSTVAYYIVPGMKYFRHIGLSIGIFKLFVPLLAGFGLDAYLSRTKDNKFSRILLPTGLLILLCIDAVIWQWAGKPFTNELYTALKLFVITLPLTAIGMFLLRRSPASCIIIAICVEMLGYQVLVSDKFKIWTPASVPPSFTHIEKPEFYTTRTMTPSSQRALALSEVSQFLLNQPFGMYNFYYNFISWDSCLTNLRAEFSNLHVAELVEARGGAARELTIMVPYYDKFAMSAIACESPKLGFATHVSFINSDQDGATFIRNFTQAPGIVIANVPENLKIAAYRSQDSGIAVTDFTYNRLQTSMHVPENEGAWLYYADGFNPAWHATLDDKETEIYKANLGFKAVYVPKGDHIVKFMFKNSAGALFAIYSTILAGLLFTFFCIYQMFSTIKQCSSSYIKLSSESN